MKNYKIKLICRDCQRAVIRTIEGPPLGTVGHVGCKYCKRSLTINFSSNWWYKRTQDYSLSVENLT